MVDDPVSRSFQSLLEYCEKERYQGWDPYDGLNSRLFQALPLMKKSRLCRLAWIQFFKRSPINFRKLTGVPKEYNTKGLGLFLTGYCNLFSTWKKPEHLEKIHWFAKKLIELQSQGYAGAAWGYNFDWQARAFFQPKFTPTVVATSFVADSLFNAYEVTRERLYLSTAISAADFLLKDLNRTYDEKGNLAFSYSPQDQTQVFNASLLGARLLSRTFHYTRNEDLKSEARKAVEYVADRQQKSGAWAYGTLPFHQWIDNFHTGFNLECIYEYQKYTGDARFEPVIAKGLHFYLTTFFTPDGLSKYYHDKLYPIDIHSPAQLIVTLAKMDKLNDNTHIVVPVLQWTNEHMRDRTGYYYYQYKKMFSSKIPYMRWAQAWMFYAMSYYLKTYHSNDDHKNSHTGYTD